MAALAAMRPLLAAAWWQRDARSPWGARLLLAVLGLAFLTGWWFIPGGVPQRIYLGCAAVSVLIAAWLAVIGSLLDQNHPHAARLVPGHLRRLRHTALAAWLLITPLLAGSLYLALVGLWSPWLALLLSAATLVYAAWASRQWMLWMVFWVGPTFYGLLHAHLAPLGEPLRALWRQQAPALTGLALLGLAALLLGLFGSGDTAHTRRQARRSRWRRMAQDGMAGRRSGLTMFGRPGEWLARPFEGAASAWLAHVLATARPERRSVMARLEIALHGIQHWVRQSIALAVALGLVGLGLGLAFAFAGADAHQGLQQGAAGMAFGLASGGINPSFTLPTALWHTRREQALLCLLPGVPRRGALNRELAFLQLRHFGVAWGLTMLATGVLVWAADMGSVLCIPAAALPIGVISLTRSPARLRAPNSWSAALPAFGFMLLGGALMGLKAWLNWPVAGLVAACLLLGLALLAWRWRVLGCEPAALPAGRLS